MNFKKTILKNFFLLILFFGVFGLVKNTWAATINAAVCSQSAVQTAVNNASRGDTVNIPAGDCTWSSTVSFTKALIIQGAGKDKTFIRQGQSGSYYLLSFTPSDAASDLPYTLRITGITFDMNYQAYGIRLQNRTATFPLTNVIIDNNSFIDCWDGDVVSGDPMSYTLNWYGHFNGLVHSNSFYGWPYIANAGDKATEWNYSDYNVNHGTAGFIYYEDNYFYSDGPGTYEGAEPFIVECGAGSKIVVRYNDFISNRDYNLLAKPWSPHHPIAPNNYGGKGGEFYGNYLYDSTQSHSWLWATPRAGKNLMFYNRIYAPGANIQWTMYNPSSYPPSTTNNACGSDVYSPWIGQNYCDVAGQPQHLYKTYQWVNKYGTTGLGSYTGASVSMGTPPRLTENSHFYNYKETFNGTAGIGCGTYAAMAAISVCTNGVGFWVPNATLDSSASSCRDLTGWVGKNNIKAASVNGKIGTMYRCSNNRWVEYYQPYAYPHPLRGGTTNTAPNAPTGVRVI